MDDETIDKVALALAQAEARRCAVPLLSGQYPRASYADARRIARARDTLRREAGEHFAGYKLGWTSAAMRKALGIEQPNWGTLWQEMRVTNACPADRFIHAKAEPEIAFIAGNALNGAVDTVDVLASQCGWALALEIVDPRWPGYAFTFVDNTADNSSAAGYVLGEPATLDFDPAELSVEFGSCEGVRRGGGGAAMGSPAAAVAWLVARLAEEGGGLGAGEIVLTGGLTAPVDVAPGQQLTLRAAGLAGISVQFF